MAKMGRPKGALNKSTADVKKLAQKHSRAAIAKLVQLMDDPETPAATQRAAANDILDRGYGKPHQAVTNEDGSNLFPTSIEVVLVKAKS